MIRRQVYDDMDVGFNEGLRRSFATMTYLNGRPDLGRRGGQLQGEAPTAVRSATC